MVGGERAREGEREVCYLLVQMPAITRAGSDWSQDSRTQRSSSMWVAETQTAFCLAGCALAGGWIGGRRACTQTRPSDLGCRPPKP